MELCTMELCMTFNALLFSYQWKWAISLWVTWKIKWDNMKALNTVTVPFHLLFMLPHHQDKMWPLPSSCCHLWPPDCTGLSFNIMDYCIVRLCISSCPPLLWSQVCRYNLMCDKVLYYIFQHAHKYPIFNLECNIHNTEVYFKGSIGQCL